MYVGSSYLIWFLKKMQSKAMLDLPLTSGCTEPALFGLYQSASWIFTMSMIDVSLSTILRKGGEVVAGVGRIGNRSRHELLGI